jgi:hypothetical protein
LNKIVSELEDDNIFKCELKDSTLYSIPNFKEKFSEEKFSIPNIDDSFYSIRDNIDVLNSIIYGLKMEKSIFLNQKGIEKSKKYLGLVDSAEIGRGYSNGVIVDNTSRFIIYWVMIW